MLDIDIEETLIKKAGGKFALTKLFQLRMIELNRGAAPLVRVESHNINPRRIVVQEILEDKIQLVEREDGTTAIAVEKHRIEAATEIQAAPPAAPDSEVYGSDIKKIKEQRIKELAQLLNPKK